MAGRPSERASRSATIARTLAALSVIVALIVVTRSLPVAHLLQWLNHRVHVMGAGGPVLFGLLYVGLTLLFLPGVPIALASGAAFGPVTGAVVISTASMVSAALAFVAARYLAGEPVARKVRHYPRIRAIYEAMRTGEGWKVVVAVRLSHAMPFGLQNYLLGLTPVRFRTYLLASWLVMLPGAILYAYVGHLGAGLLEDAVGEPAGSSPVPGLRLFRVLGLVVALAAIVYVYRFIRRAMRKATDGDPGLDALVAAAPDVGPPRWQTPAFVLVAALALAVAVVSYTRQNQMRQTVESWLSEAP
jgi:uncharacterized membrane protein YdjX (TVP38/TMEM64 family)